MITRTRSFLVLLLALFAAACATAPAPKPLDLKIVNGRIVDGTGAPWFRADVGIRGDSIVAVGDLSATPAAATIDARQQIVSPGFIDLLGQSQMSVLVDPSVEPKVRQGVTTEVTGEGHSPGPSSTTKDSETRWPTLGDYLDQIDRRGAGVNFALLVGASNPRDMVIGAVNRPPTADELTQMEGIVSKAMRDGAIGISTSLIYVPAMYSTTEEIIALARVAAQYDGVYFTHMRDEGDRVDMGLDEAFRVGREAGIPVNIWHLKAAGRANWGRMPHIIERIEEARKSGIDVAANVYPYAASATGLSTLAPDWALEGGYEAFRARLRDPNDRAKIAEVLQKAVAKRGEKAIFVTRMQNPAHAAYEKKYIEEIAAAMGVAPDEALMRLYEENTESPQVIFFSMSEDDVRTALQQPWVSLGSDSGAPTPEARQKNLAVHPRGYGTFPRFIGRYARDQHLATLEDAVRRVTSLAAQRAHLYERGVIRPGMKADVIVFDPDKIIDRSDYANPHQFSEGVIDVIVNGQPVLRDGNMTGALPGHSLRGSGYVKPAK